MKLLIRWLIIATSLFLAAWLVPGIHVDGNAWVVFGIMAIILGLVNALIRPVLKFLSCGLILITMGLFSLVINAATFMLASRVAETWFNIGFHVDNFWAALLGAIIVSVVSTILNSVLVDEKRQRNKR